MIRRHLLFDFGGPVLLTPFELADAAAAKLGVERDALSKGPYDPDDLAWRQRVDGTITERQYWTDEAARFGLDVLGLMEKFFEPSGDHLTRPESCELVDEVLAAGRVVGVLTNDLSNFHGPGWHDAITVLTRFDPIVDLSHTGHLKPDPRAYADGIAAMRRVAGGVEPGEIVYVDDHLDNVAGGTDAGMVSLWFDITDPADSHRRIRSALEGDDPT